MLLVFNSVYTGLKSTGYNVIHAVSYNYLTHVLIMSKLIRNFFFNMMCITSYKFWFSRKRFLPGAKGGEGAVSIGYVCMYVREDRTNSLI